MAKKKQTPDGPLSPKWVRYTAPPSMPHGPTRLGPFGNDKGRAQFVTFAPDQWVLCNGEWAANLAKHPVHGPRCEFSDDKPE